MLDLMLFTDDPALALRAEQAGVGRIVVDLEQRGKDARQVGYHLEKNAHSAEDIRAIRAHAKNIPVMARLNPFDENSPPEIDRALEAGASILMLPMFKNADEAAAFVETVAGRARTNLLLETSEALENLEALKPIPFDELYVGLNDLGIALGRKFCFELATDGTLERIRTAFPEKPFGFGGITVVGGGSPLPSIMIIKELARLRSSLAIVRRAFKKDTAGMDLRVAVDGIQDAFAAAGRRSLIETEAEHRNLADRIGKISRRL